MEVLWTCSSQQHNLMSSLWLDPCSLLHFVAFEVKKKALGFFEAESCFETEPASSAALYIIRYLTRYFFSHWEPCRRRLLGRTHPIIQSELGSEIKLTLLVSNSAPELESKNRNKLLRQTGTKFDTEVRRPNFQPMTETPIAILFIATVWSRFLTLLNF